MTKESKNTIWWIVGIVIALVLFGDLIFAVIGSILGAILAIGITGIVLFAVAAAAFALVVLVGGSVAVATGVAFFAVVIAALGALWPFIILAAIVYLMVRKRPQAV
jgi:hypothetical protein